MSKILLIGRTPPSLVKGSKIEAANYRTWQFMDPLLENGHTICLCADGPTLDAAEPAHGCASPTPHLHYQPIAYRRPGWMHNLQQAHDRFAPDCIIAVDFHACLRATRLRTTRPIWMDIYGDTLTILQAACYRARSDRGLQTSLAFFRQVMDKGDIFSVCGTPQKHMLVGELAMAQRLNWHTFGYEFVQVVLPGAPPTPFEDAEGRERQVLASQGVADDAFVVLWCGGYNTWTDVDTLFAAVNSAMAEEPRLHYVSVGASTYEAADNAYARFLSMIEASPYRGRYHMLGWRPYAEVAQYYRESELGLSIDAMHYETVYGTRTRLLEMMAAGLPVITSLGSELSYVLRARGAGLTFEIGDWRALGEQIVALARDPSRRADLAHAAHAYATGEVSFSATTAPVQAWVCNPQPAPDKSVAGRWHQMQDLEHHARTVLRQVVWRTAGLDK